MSKRKRNSKNTYFWIFAAILLIMTVVIVVIIYKSPVLPKPSEYLSVSHSKSLGKFYSNTNEVQITHLGLDIIAIAGDAHSIVIQIDEGRIVGPSNLIDQPGNPIVIPFLSKGEKLPLEIDLQGCILPLESGKCIVHIYIGCSEAPGPEEILIEILKEDIVSFP